MSAKDARGPRLTLQNNGSETRYPFKNPIVCVCSMQSIKAAAPESRRLIFPITR